jgi:GNAT superfamily N-acetyltransferase
VPPGDLRVLTANDVPRAVDVLTRAFEREPLTTYLLHGVRNPGAALRANMGLAVRTNVPGGHVFGLGDDLIGVAILQPQRPRFGLGAVAGPFARWAWHSGVSGISRNIRVGHEFNQRRPKTPHLYLAGVGVDPQHQKQGHGRRLIAGLVVKAREQGHSLLYLDTSDEENVPFYESCGFKVLNTWTPDAGAGPPTWSMYRGVDRGSS